jgi:putative aldouronate transport system substrate-binding protein
MANILFSWKKVYPAVLASALLAGMLAACGGNGAPAEEGAGTDDITVMLPAFETDVPDDSGPVVQKLNEYTGKKVHVEWVPSSSYEDKFNITLASGKMPELMVVLSKSPSFINAARNGAFWELTPYLKDYPNLSQMNEIVMNNSSIDGKIYGIYRARPLGRNGIVYRKDWLAKAGLEEPETIDDFYKMLVAFTKDDPDGNGKDDTYGLVASKYNGVWDNMTIWFGAPNKWGEDGNGKLQPAHLTPEYMEALKFFRKLYSEGLVNKDFAVMDSLKMPDELINNKGGVMVDVADAGQRIDEKIQAKTPGLEVIDVLGTVEGPKGLRVMPTSGYNGMIAISKSAVPTEEKLKEVLTFLDKLNDEEMQVLLSNGIEGEQYTLEGDYAIPTTDKVKLKEVQGLNQMLMFLPEDRFKVVKPTPVRAKTAQVQKANLDIVVPNPAEPLVSDVYARKGAQMDNIINDARTKYIVGQIDEKGFEEAIKLWRSSGGDEYIAEINKLYAELGK